MKRKSTKSLCAAVITAGLFGLQGCVSVAPLEPIKNPPTNFRSDNAVEVEFLSPAMVGLRCGERGTSFYGMPVFHAMACGNGKLITMPNACETFTGGAYADIVCETREQARDLQSTFRGMLISASLSATGSTKVRTEEKALKDGASITVEFIHPASVAQRCLVIGADLVKVEELYSCAAPDRIVLPNPCMSLEGGWYARTLCHEMAHANGWAMDHPGGSYLSDKKAGVDPADVPPPRAIMASLESGAPLRKASESAVYLAYAAQKEASGVQYASLAVPAADLAPQARSSEPPLALRALASVKLLNASLPDVLSDLRQFAATFRLPEEGMPVHLASLTLRPKADLSPVMALASLDLAAPASEPDAGVSSGGLLEEGAGLANAMLASVFEDVPEGTDLAAANVSPAGDRGQQPARTQFTLSAMDLRRRMETPASPQPESLSEAEVPELPAEEAGPQAPSRKPLRPYLWREDEDGASAAGV
ncbi:MAG TPA: hypothetical protein PKV67_17815 [Hyphomonas sp.]|nr:hypothetical protein [Hyphomonas sp.]HRJ02607.1 hypothetical protein [Hyphomonas sp.]HRK68375.1 hypothetical protein [Hyphomonas sp.]